MNSNQINEITNNNTGEIANLSGNMYSYNDDSIRNPPHESNAIRRSIGEGINPSLNNLPTMIPSRDIDQFNQPTQNPVILGEPKITNLPQYPNYIDNRSSEQRLPHLQENKEPIKMPQVIEQHHQPPLYLPKPRGPKKFYFLTFTIISIYHILMIVLIGCFFEFPICGDNLYIFFKDVHLMLFVGFGFLYTLLKDHQWSSVAIILFIGTISIEFSFFCFYLWDNAFNKQWEKKKINFNNLINIDYISATVFISLGAIIGKLSIIQYFWVAVLETFFSSFNFFLCYKKIEAIDNGGSIYVFAFGAIFGVVMSIILFCRETEYSKISNNPHLNSDYYSNLFSFIGTLFLWLYFPSFNIANIQNFEYKYIHINMRYRGIINTYLSMIGSVISTFIVSPLIYKGKMKIEHLLNSSYVGGVIIGGCCTICNHGWASILIGFIGGGVSIFCLSELKPIFKNNKLEDTFGILHIFGIPGILGGFLTCIFIGSDKSIVKEIFNKENEEVKSSSQAGLQAGAIMVTIAIAALSGLISGFIVNSMSCDKNDLYFVDSELFTEDENIPLPEWKYPRQNDINLSSSGNKLDEQGREVNIEQEQ